ncbi:MAG TPA: helix-turn-helix transcriptional regulator [Herpetosiphonaceae bacterium]|nr:helix-turn-helix transcriptional regulator [Herpetosiphonaceae bacterium]
MPLRSIANHIVPRADAERTTSRENVPATSAAPGSTRSDALPPLHWLRRSRQLSLSELASLTGIPMRRLAAYEYTQGDLSSADRERLAEVFGVGAECFRSGIDTRQAAVERGWVEPRTQHRLTAVVAAALLSLSLHAPSKAHARSVTLRTS